MGRIRSWKEKAAQLRNEVFALYLASKNPRVPWYAKAFMIAILAYALSPIDLIPDFIPILGQLDDLVLVPAGIALLLRIIPKEVMEEARVKAKSELMDGKKNWIAAAIILLIWLLALYLVVSFVWESAFMS